jgi:predicted acyl esterase
MTALLAVGCGSGSIRPSISPERSRSTRSQPPAEPSWFRYQRPAGYGVAVENVRVPARDGTSLACALFRPARGGRPAPGRFPVVLSELFPYYGQYLKPTDNAEATYFAARGYADLVCSTRGTYNSTGRFAGWFTPIDITDDYDVIEWAAKQPWSTGRVGQEGGSYGGINALRAAAAVPPHLVAIAPQFAFHNAYLDYFYPGGISNDISQSPAPGVMDFRGITPSQQWAIWKAHPLDDAFWQRQSVHTARIRVPTLMVGGWADYMVTGDIANYQTISRSNTWLVMGPWVHNGAPVSDTAPMLLLWFDHWLKQLPAAQLPSARVTSFEMPSQGGRGWREMVAYPPPDAHPTFLDVRTDRTLSSTAGPAGSTTYRVNPHDRPAAICFPPYQSPCSINTDMGPSDSKRLTFTTAPLRTDLVVIGSVQVHLRAALTARDGNFVVKLMDVAPDGKVHQASVGYLKASHRLSHNRPTPVTPGRMTDFPVTLWPTDWRFQAGHQLRVSLTSGDLPKIAADAPAGTVTLATGEAGSYLELLARTAVAH